MFKNVLQICAGVLSVAYSSRMDTRKAVLDWDIDILQNKISVSSFRQVEPGFDLTEEEILKFKIWRHGVIPYYIDTISFDKVLRDKIRSFLEITSGLTGLQFLELPNPPADSKTRWVFFINRRGLLGCADHSPKNFTNEGVQKVVLGYDCMINGGELAEAVLILTGVPHQHNSPDRDEYITVDMNKIIPAKRYLYEKLGNKDWLFHDLEYDFSSAGHYHFHKNTIDGTATIDPMKPVDVLVGEGEGLSYVDVLKIRMLYNYITRKPYAHSKGSECRKLFKPGSKLATDYSLKADENQPRKKPNLYLGLPLDHIPKSDNENGKDDGHDDSVDHVDEDINGSGNDDEGSNKNSALKGDPLLVLSDYETDDGRNKKKYKKLNHPIKIRRKAKMV